MTTTEQRLRELRRELRSLSWRRRRRVLEEARDHLLSAVEDGADDAEAAAQLGEPRVAFTGFPARRRTHRAALVVVPVAFLAFAAPISGTLVKIGAGPAPSQAATNPILQQTRATARCVQAWNAPSNARYRAITHASGAALAHAGAWWEGKAGLVNGKLPTMHIAGCTVRLVSAHRASSPYQPWVAFYAKVAGSSFRFERMARGRMRSAAPSENATIDGAGRLTLSLSQIRASCPGGPTGTGIQSVVAVPSGPKLELGATTAVAASRETFAVALRNTGRSTIRGAIANLEVYGPAHPDRPWWRSKPVTVNRLTAGATVTIRFSPPPLGHGIRLVRTTTAAVACETKLGDNSPVFRVRAS